MNISAKKAQILMKFYVVVNYYLVSMCIEFHQDLCINARTRILNARARDKPYTRVFITRARVFMHKSSWNFKYKSKIVIDHRIKFHQDPSFRCRDICKTILVFFNHWFSMYFWYFCNYAPPKPSKMDNFWMIVGIFSKLDLKMVLSQWNENTSPSSYFVF